MSRYFTRPTTAKFPVVRADDWYAETGPFVTSLTVCDHEATDTGLLDQHGDAIMRAPRPIDFGRDDEW